MIGGIDGDQGEIVYMKLTQWRARLAAWLLATLGPRRYAALIDTLDRGVTAFLITFAAKTILADGFNVSQALHVSWWQTAALAALAAAVSVIKSAVMTMVTGVPALLSPLSRTLRSHREHPIPQHKIPIHPEAK